MHRCQGISATRPNCRPRDLGASWRDSRASGLLHVPLEYRWAEDQPFEAFAISRHSHPFSDRNIGHDLKGALLDLGRKLLAGFDIRRPEPLDPQCLDLVVARPAEPCHLAVRPQP